VIRLISLFNSPIPPITSRGLSTFKMPIRQANYSDLRPAAEVAAAAFLEDELFGELMHPYRHQYPEDFIHAWQQDFRAKWLQRAYVFLVAVDDNGKVVGLATWERECEERQYGHLDPSSSLQSDLGGLRWD
jgi:hypothetical protein